MIDKRTIEADYVRQVMELYEDEYPTVLQVLHRFLSKYEFTTEQIEKIAEEETFDTVISAVRFADYLGNVKKIMEQFARIEYKTLGEINSYFESILAKRYNTAECAISVYEAIHPALKRLHKDGLVEIIDNPEHEGWFLYKYIG